MSPDLAIERAAAKLLRRYGHRAKSEAFQWLRHFIETGDTAERRFWTRIAWTVRARAA